MVAPLNRLKWYPSGNAQVIPSTLPILVEVEGPEIVGQFAALSRLLPKTKNGSITLVNLSAFESKPLTLVEAIRALKDAQNSDPDIWLVVRS